MSEKCYPPLASAHPTDPSPPEKCPDLTYLLRQPPNPPESRAISHELGSQLIVMRPGLDLETPYEPRFHTPTPCADHFSRPNSRCLHFDPKNGNRSIRCEDGLPGCEQPLTTTHAPRCRDATTVHPQQSRARLYSAKPACRGVFRVANSRDSHPRPARGEKC